MAKTAATSKRGPHPPRKGGRPAKKPFKVGGADGRNATGYQKRQERKNKQREEQNPDVYEYAVGKNKRAGISMQLDDDELLGNDKHGAEDDDNDNSDMEKLRRKIAANMEGDMGVVDSEDDEDIDSDAAFEGESDEERFGAFKFAESSKKSTQKPQKTLTKKRTPSKMPLVNLNEDDDGPGMDSHNEEESDDDDADADEDEDEGGISLSAMLNGEAPDEVSEDSADEEDEDEDEDLLNGSEDDASAPDDEALDKLDSFIGDLSSRKRKAVDMDAPQSSAARKRRVLPERNEAGAESEFAAPGNKSGKLRLDDLLAPLASTSTPESLASLNKSAKLLASSKTQPLSAPLHQRQQDRLDREAAYQETKEEVQKWAPTMKRIREAEHLSFPLQAPPVANTSNAALASQFKPSNELESAVDKLLKSAKLREQDVPHTEELQMKNLTLEEVAARRAELRQTRELMFRADIKAKRVAKIKSKAYRRIQRKEAEKNKLDLSEIQALDPEAADAERLKLEVARAKERATMRHKNTGKWAKQMKQHGALDVDQRRELNAQLERGELLRRKIQGLGEDDEGGDDSGSEHDGVEGVAASAFDELAALDVQDRENVIHVSGPGNKSGLLDMKFMRDAQDREQKRADAMADDFRAELVGMTATGEDLPDDPTSSQTVQGNQGRMVFRPNAPKHGRSLPILKRGINSNESDTSSVTLKSSDLASNISTHPLSPQQSFTAARSTGLSEPNPWLVQSTESTSKVSRKKNEAVASKNSTFAIKSKNALKKQLDKTEEVQTREKDDEVVEISLDDALTISTREKEQNHVKGSAQNNKGKGNANTVDSAYRNSDDEGDDVEDHGETGNGVKAFSQRQLVALAFAGDNVVEEFTAQKKRAMEADAPTEVDTTLPGWGDWGGVGLKKKTPKPQFIKKIAGVDPKSRKDYGKAHLIISEKKDKKASKYLVKDLPHPYTSKEQFERSLETPVGAEWNTRIAFQKGTIPRVVKKIGAVIRPLEKLA